MYAGMFAGVFSVFSREEPDGIEVQCYAMGNDCCKFLIGSKSRVNAAEFWRREGGQRDRNPGARNFVSRLSDLERARWETVARLLAPNSIVRVAEAVVRAVAQGPAPAAISAASSDPAPKPPEAAKPHEAAKPPTLTLDLTQATTAGLIEARLEHSICGAVIHDEDDFSDPLMCGILASLLTYLSGQDIDCVQTECISRGAEASRFVITGAARLEQAEANLKAGMTHEELVACV